MRFRESTRYRYTMYVIGFILMLGCIFSMFPFMNKPESIPTWAAILFSTLAPTVFLFGFCKLLAPALVGRAVLFKWFTSLGIFLVGANLAATMYLIGPLICLWYYLSSG